jgi:hypothetical protein
MKNSEILTLARGLPLVNVPDMDGDFNYAISDNLLRARMVAISIKKATEATDAVKNYEKELSDLQKEHAEKDPLGEIIYETFTIGDQTMTKFNIVDFAIPNSPFNKAAAKLKRHYQKELDAHTKKMEFLNKENKEFKPLMISKKLIPKGLPRDVMNIVYLLIEKEV